MEKEQEEDEDIDALQPSIPKKKKRLSNIDTFRHFLKKKSMIVFPSRRKDSPMEMNILFKKREFKKKNSTKSVLKAIAKLSKRYAKVNHMKRKTTATATVLKYPMFLINFSTLKKLYEDGSRKIESFQTLQKRGDLVKWNEKLKGQIIFVSHEWLAFNHPDPKSEQMTTLIRARTSKTLYVLASKSQHIPIHTKYIHTTQLIDYEMVR